MNELIIQSTNPPCKTCGSTHVRKYGLYKGVQRYFCNDCGSKFKNDDTLFHMKTPANQVSSALNMFYEGMSIKAIRRNLQQEYGNMPSTATIYEWIQKYTQYATDSIKGYQPKNIGNTWIADETVLEIDGNIKPPPIQIGRTPKRIRRKATPKLSNQVLVLQNKGGDVLYSRSRKRGTKIIGKMGRGR